MSTKIEWCDEVWNVVTGCTKISLGCKHCCAENFIKRFGHNPGNVTKKAKWGDNCKDFNVVTIHPERLSIPYRWKKPITILVCFLGDLFHEDVSFDFIDDVFSQMYAVDRHIYLVLTKRPRRMRDYVAGITSFRNIWLGVSVEDQKTADERIPILLQIPASKHFVSIEPMLGPVDIYRWLTGKPTHVQAMNMESQDNFNFPKLDWVITGCESGPKRRPTKFEWFRSLLDQCIYADVPFFLKQMDLDGKVVKMPEFGGKIWDQKP